MDTNQSKPEIEIHVSEILGNPGTVVIEKQKE